MNSLTELIPWYAWFLPLIIPFIIERLTKSTMATWKKSLIAFLVCVLIALGAVALVGKLDWKNILATLGIIFTEAQLLYDNFFKEGIKARQATRENTT